MIDSTIRVRQIRGQHFGKRAYKRVIETGQQIIFALINYSGCVWEREFLVLPVHVSSCWAPQVYIRKLSNYTHRFTILYYICTKHNNKPQMSICKHLDIDVIASVHRKLSTTFRSCKKRLLHRNCKVELAVSFICTVLSADMFSWISWHYSYMFTLTWLCTPLEVSKT